MIARLEQPAVDGGHFTPVCAISDHYRKLIILMPCAIRGGAGGHEEREEAVNVPLAAHALSYLTTLISCVLPPGAFTAACAPPTMWTRRISEQFFYCNISILRYEPRHSQRNNLVLYLGYCCYYRQIKTYRVLSNS